MTRRAGFTLVEVLIVVLILGLLASLAFGQYRSFTTRAAYAEVLIAVKVYRSAVELCALQNPISSCDTGVNGIPNSNPTQLVSSVVVSNGEITVTPKSFRSVTSSDVYTLTPTGGGSGVAITGWSDNCATNQFC